ncbi:hypothetical protein BU26DRAFT_565931 [Trematosphaeria pertusa]|uniref:Uncharacterized protein n=1 Tax=Trematosphaeria pertusa TaxID=390896 RepID=A0A6A6IEB6_9PLEO|nr:uncharacterized protein BU26DRAFT_565931 [Trematosphaeria pertusa]KAF2248547.1 hypothetical protein BU26DRAFT_565931 [Trematosphaeria pertusa]
MVCVAVDWVVLHQTHLTTTSQASKQASEQSSIRKHTGNQINRTPSIDHSITPFHSIPIQAIPPAPQPQPHRPVTMSSQSLTPRSSLETTKTSFTTSTTSTSTSTASLLPKPSSKAAQLWSAIKKHAKEHHESVNNAYALYYGQGQMRTYPQQPQSQAQAPDRRG